MNKTISINLSGMVFQIEEPGYLLLTEYLNKLKQTFKNEEGGEEIIADIETRLAEILGEQKGTENTAITTENIQQAIQELGQPEDFEQNEDQPGSTKSKEQEFQEFRPKRRIFRNEDDKVLGGVCSGLAAYFDVDPLYIRLGTALLYLFFGVGIVLYIVLCIIIPAAKTRAEKLQMKGEAVNLKTLKDSVEQELKSVGENLGKRGAEGTLMSLPGKFFSALGQIILAFFKLLVKAGAVFLIFIGTVLTLALLVGAFAIWFGGDALSSPDNPFKFADRGQQIFLSISLLFAAGIPLIIILSQAVRFLFKISVQNKILNYSLLILWILGIIGVIGTGVSIASNFRTTETIKKTQEIIPVNGNKLYLKLREATLVKGPSEVEIKLDNSDATKVVLPGKVRFDDISLTIEKSESDKAVLYTYVTSRGSSKEEAITYARQVEYFWNQNDSVLEFDPVYILKKGSQWRNQKVKLILKLPIGFTFELSPSMQDILNEKSGIIWEDDFTSKSCSVNPEGVYCTECDTCKSEKGSSLSFKNIDLKNVKFIEIDDDLEATVETGSKPGIRFKGSYTDSREVEVEIKNETLTLGRSGRDFFRSESDNIRIYVTLPDLKSVKTSGSSSATLKYVEVKEISISSSGASSIEMQDCKFGDARIRISGSSEMDGKAEGDKMMLEISGSASYSGENILFKNAVVKTSGSSESSVHVSDDLEIESSGSSEVYYYGAPKVRQSRSGAATIEKR